MIVVGLTGGIGSGKTTVAKFFHELGVPVYLADLEAKKLMGRSKVIKRKLIALFGEQAYSDGQLNKTLIAEKIFNDKELLEKMNAIIHPKVKAHFKRWLKKQQAPYVINEAAILFENGSFRQYDLIITVTAPKNERLRRVMRRDGSSEKKVRSIMKNQWTDERKVELSDFVIENIDLKETKKRVKRIHRKILRTRQ
ncbi:MAG: dephospho-CoA kinase [Bacteroidia bacterium]|nr:dephospho-CoA kinase [Bacteroidia bacterium]NND51559.1 dephospho-CoA kinase [Flavobacteriaceae bacterium]